MSDSRTQFIEHRGVRICFNKPYVIAGAIVGMSPLMSVVLTAVSTFTRRKFSTFGDLDSAKDWLAEQ